MWIYDKDLNQVIVKKLDKALGATPAALLTGNDALETNFDLSGRRDHGVEYVNAKPKTTDTGFDSVRIGLKEHGATCDGNCTPFGQTTTLMFGSFERNPQLDASTFCFTLPQAPCCRWLTSSASSIRRRRSRKRPRPISLTK